MAIAFVSMLCLYYYLARTEERICLEKYGEPYQAYLGRTGMFLPRKWEAKGKAIDWRLPESRVARVAAGVLAYLVIISITITALGLTRAHVVESLQMDANQAPVIVFLAPPAPDTREATRNLLIDAALPANGEIAYVAPASWSVPELGLRRTVDVQSASGVAELLHPTTHGNSLAASQERLNVVVAQATYPDNPGRGAQRLSRALNLRPLQFLELDISRRMIIEQREADDSQWAGIPVPTF